MWNGEYFVHLYPRGFKKKHTDRGIVSPEDEQNNASGYIDAFEKSKDHYFMSTACDAQQLFGQNWAHQLDLGYILPAEHCKKAAAGIFRYNWTPDISTVYDIYPARKRTLAAPGEGAMVSGSWPKEERLGFENTHDKDDVWSGLEYQSACDMINEGLLREAFVMLRAIHERYDASKRNPWNEIEGAEHYSRAMHSWNVLLTLSGYSYDGPAGRIGFAPQITPEQFQCFFSAAEGWGSFSQSLQNGKLEAAVKLHWGKLRLKELALDSIHSKNMETVSVELNGKPLDGSVEQQDKQFAFHFSEDTVISAGDRLSVRFD